MFLINHEKMNYIGFIAAHAVYCNKSILLQNNYFTPKNGGEITIMDQNKIVQLSQGLTTAFINQNVSDQTSVY